PTVSGTGTSGNTVTLYVTEANGQREVGKALVVDGKWTVEVTDALNFGLNVFTAVAMDTAGNLSPHSKGYGVTVTTNDGVGNFDLSMSQSAGPAINTTVAGNQNNPQVTKLANGNLVVVWQSYISDYSHYDVYMQLLDPTGKYKIGREQLVNQVNGDSQDSPQVIALADGGFVVTYESWKWDGSSESVLARKYNSQGAPETNEFLVNQTTYASQRSPGGLALKDGGYILSWHSDQGGGSIVQRIYNAANQPVTPEMVVSAGGASKEWGGPRMTLLGDTGWYLTVWSGIDTKNDVLGQLRKIDGSTAGPILTLNTTLDGHQNYPNTITLKDGSFVVYWDSADSQSIGVDIRAAHYSFNPDTGALQLVGTGDFIVNTTRAGKQYKSVGVALDDGGYMLIWGSEGGDGNGSAIFAQRFDAKNNKVGHEFLVNPTTWGNQGTSAEAGHIENVLDATLLDNGNIFVTWHSNMIDPSGYGIEGVTLDIDAGFYSEFTVNTIVKNNQQRASTTELPGGGFMVVWESYATGNWDIQGQIFDASGMPVGDEFTVNSVTAGHQTRPDVTILADGKVVVTWHDSSSGVDVVRSQTYGYSYNDTGKISGLVPHNGEYRVNATSGANRAAQVSALDDGGYVITWQAIVAKQWAIMMRHYDSDGLPITGDLLVAVTSVAESSAYYLSSTTTLADGRVAIAYMGKENGSDIKFKLYDPQTHQFGPEILANQTQTGSQTAPGVAMLTNGNLVITWDSKITTGPDRSGFSMWARIYTPDGIPVGNEFLVNTFTPGDQLNGYAIARPGGGFVVVYESVADQAPGAGTLGIYAQFFDNAGNRIGQELRIHQLEYGTQTKPDVAFLEDGRMFVSWTDAGVGDDSGSAIKGRIIDIDTTLNLGIIPQVPGIEDATQFLAADATQGSLWMLFDDGSASGLLLDSAVLSSVRGGAGNDFIAIKDTSFAMIDGGDGIDTLLLDGK
ncbi:hypothetical protein SAMN06295949_1671, partial [Pseudomonas delhiensis]